MIRIWSERRGARMQEMVADAATAAWIVVWGGLAWQLYQLVAAFAEAGRLVRSGGEGMIEGGRTLGDALAGVPLVGPGLRDVAESAFAGAGLPLSDFGTGIEEFILLVATVLALLLVLATLVP